MITINWSILGNRAYEGNQKVKAKQEDVKKYLLHAQNQSVQGEVKKQNNGRDNHAQVKHNTSPFTEAEFDVSLTDLVL